MTNAKRASMREGPLADLFRKTGDDASPADEKPRQEAQPDPEPESPAAKSRPSAAVEPEPDRRSHPSLHSSAPEPEVEEPRIPSPQERLRHAFSSDIPENVLERPAGRARRPAPEPEVDVYARSARSEEAFGVARPVG